ncbi:MAG: hypothetical protein ACXW0Q_13635 [Methylovulum sp.]
MQPNSNVIYLLRKLAACFVVFFATLSGLYWAFGEAAVYYEMWATNTLTREALADDLGGDIGCVAIKRIGRGSRCNHYLVQNA